MPYDEGLKERLDDLLDQHFSHIRGLQEKKMFGGIGYMLNGNMCIGIYKDELIVRVGIEASDHLCKKHHLRPMDLTGKIMKGWVMIKPEGLTEDDDLIQFCQTAIDFVHALPSKY